MNHIDIETIARQSRAASSKLAVSSETVRNRTLKNMAEALSEQKQAILTANAEEVSRAQQARLPEAMVKRLTISEKVF